MSGPGPNKTPVNHYVTRLHKAVLIREAHLSGKTCTALVAEFIERLRKKQLAAGLPDPRPVKRYAPDWLKRVKPNLGKGRDKMRAKRKR
jgi:hypothetical protein